MKTILRLIASAALLASIAQTHAGRRTYEGIEDTTMTSQGGNTVVLRQHSVPDGGTTMLLLGSGALVLAMSRKFLRKS